jgi:Tfp pilus assembly protein PilF
MPERDRLSVFCKQGLLYFVFLALQACSVFPQLVRHQDPLTPEEHARLGATYAAQGQSENASRQYAAALHEDKNNVPILMSAGNLAFQSGDFRTAEKFYRRILRIDPLHSGANNNLAMVALARGGDLNQAEQRIRTALQREDGLRPYILETLSQIQARRGQFDLARNSLAQAEAAIPPGDDALRTRLEHSRQDLEKAAPRASKTP